LRDGGGEHRPPRPIRLRSAQFAGQDREPPARGCHLTVPHDEREVAIAGGTSAVGPDLTAGISLNDIPDRGTIAGRVGDEPVLLSRFGRELYAVSGLSRLVDAYARRLQLQERMTQQIAHTLEEVLRPRGVAVVIEASHGCMSTRGVNQHGVSMVTKCWLGDFRSDPELRRELIESIRR
jgi:hypothetical protein